MSGQPVACKVCLRSVAAPSGSVTVEMQRLRSENLRLSEELRKADIVIDIQKKVAALLGRPFPAPALKEKP